MPAWERRAFPFVLPVAKLVIRRYLGVNEASAPMAVVRVDEEFDAVADRLTDGRRHLVGDRFSAADLAFAALAAPLVVPAVYRPRRSEISSARPPSPSVRTLRTGPTPGA